MAVVGTLAFNYQVLLPLLAERELGGTDATYTILTTCFSVGSLVGSLRMARRESMDSPLPRACRRSCSASAPSALAVSPNLRRRLRRPARRPATPGSACCPAATPCSSWPPARRCGAGCWPSTASSSWARRRSADRSSGRVADAFGTPAGIAIGAVASAGRRRRRAALRPPPGADRRRAGHARQRRPAGRRSRPELAGPGRPPVASSVALGAGSRPSAAGPRAKRKPCAHLHPEGQRDHAAPGTSSTPRTSCSAALATEVARILRGKHKPIFAPHIDTGDHVIVVNASKVVLTSGKGDSKLVRRHTGYPGGLKSVTYNELLGDEARRGDPPHRPGHDPEEPARPPDDQEAQGLRGTRSPALGPEPKPLEIAHARRSAS